MLLTAAGAELLSPQNVAVSSPQGSIHSGAQRTGASGRAPRLSLLPSSPMGPWPASWHCCSWREVTRFSRLRGMRPTCTGGSPPAALRGFTPPAAPDPRALSSGRCRAPPQPPPRPSLDTSWAAAQTLPSRVASPSPPPASLGQRLPEGALSEGLTQAGSSPRQPGPPPGGSPAGPWGWGLLSGVLSNRVLSSQFPGLCRLHPPLVVERAKELLEFVGSLGGPRSTGHMLTSVVRRPPPRPGPRLPQGLLRAECCSPPRCGPLASTSQCPGTGAAPRSRSTGSSKL